MYSFELTEPRVLVAETSNGFGGCPGDTLMDLRQEGYGGSCGGVYGDDKPCLAFDDDSGDKLCSRIVHRMLSPGTWWIRVSAYGGAKLNRYFLQVDFIDRQCGNGQIELTEDCDDGGTANGDCCNFDCLLEPASAPCSDGVFCNGTDSCDGAGSCNKHLGNPCAGGGICGDNCNEAADSCFDPAGTVCRASQGACDIQETCTGSSASCPSDAFLPSATVCRTSGGVCDVQETCTGSSASCPADAFQPASTPCTDDGNPCTDDVCNGSGACLNANNTAPCEDGLFCNGADTCSGGSCSAHAGSTCAGADGDGDCSESCSDSSPGCTNPDPEGAVCDDGVFCNGPDRCSAGSCSVHLGNPCVDGGICGDDCNEAADNCFDPAGTVCRASQGACDIQETCTGSSTACPANAFLPSTTVCRTSGGVCDVQETCTGSSASCPADTFQPASTPCTDDGNPCTDDVCNGSGACLNPNNTAPCDDGDTCTTASSCDGSGTCTGTAELDCDDDDPCTTDTCVGGPEPCSHEPIPDCGALLCGDVNQDGSVKASDALAALRTAVGTSDCNGEACVCDVDGGGKVTASDALAILKKAVGTAVTLNCKC